MKNQQEYIGYGVIDKLKEVLLAKNPKRIFLVRGKDSYTKSGAAKFIDPLLKDYQVSEFFDFEVNPKLEDIERGIVEFKKIDPDLVIAVGGGSAIDIAKAINVLSCQDHAPQQIIRGDEKIVNSGKYFVAIPTTSGTGSEATRYAVVYIDKTKYSLAHQLYTFPDVAIVDPNLTISLPAKITASTGMDAFGHSIESFWSVSSTDQAKDYAREAILLITNNLATAVKNSSNKRARMAMSKASNLAGKAIEITRTTACHAISYPFTSYFQVPHGHAVALTLSSILEFNSKVTEDDVLHPKGATYVRETIQELVTILGTQSVEDAKRYLNNFLDGVGLTRNLQKLGVKSEEDIDTIIQNGFNPDRVKNNPRLLTKDSLRIILNNLKI